MAVGGTAQAGVAEVAVRVVGLLQGAKHEGGIGLAAVAAALGLAGDQPARLAGELPRLLRGDRVGQGRRRDVEGRELLDQPADALGIGLFVDPVEGRDAATLEQLGDPLVGEDHQVLDQAMGLGLLHGLGTDHLTVLETELGLEALYLERGARPAAGERRRGLARERQRLGDRIGGPPPAGEDLVELVVVEAGIRPDRAAVEARRERLTGFRDLDLRGDGEPVLARHQAADVAREDLGQHRRDPPWDVGGIGAPPRLLLQSAAGADMGGHIRYVDPEAKAALRPRRGYRVVEVMGARRIDREGGEIAEVATVEGEISGGLGGVRRLTLDAASEANPQVAVREHRVDYVRRESGIAELPNHPGPSPALAELHQRHAPRARGAPPAAELDAASPLEDQLANQEAAPLGYEDDAPLGPGGWTPRGQSCPDST